MTTKEKGLYPQFNYFKTMMISGFLKSTIGTGFISIGTTIIFMGLATPNYNENAVYIGITAMAFGVLIYFAGDIYKIEQKKKEVKIIDNKIIDVEEKTETQIRNEAEKVARHIIEKAEEEKQIVIKRRMAEMEQGLCGDILKISKEDSQPTYCRQRALDFRVLAYPDEYPLEEMIRIATKKAVINNENPDNNYLKAYFEILHEDGLISKKKLTECLDAL